MPPLAGLETTAGTPLHRGWGPLPAALRLSSDRDAADGDAARDCIRICISDALALQRQCAGCAPSRVATNSNGTVARHAATVSLPYLLAHARPACSRGGRSPSARCLGWAGRRLRAGRARAADAGAAP